jgi:hypothetical protein
MSGLQDEHKFRQDLFMKLSRPDIFTNEYKKTSLKIIKTSCLQASISPNKTLRAIQFFVNLYMATNTDVSAKQMYYKFGNKCIVQGSNINLNFM